VSTGSTTPIVTTTQPTSNNETVIKSQPVQTPTNTVIPVSQPVTTEVAAWISPVIEDTTSPPENQVVPVTRRLPQAGPAENFLIGILVLSLIVSFLLRKYIL
jgi:hypothetical protein